MIDCSGSLRAFIQRRAAWPLLCVLLVTLASCGGDSTAPVEHKTELYAGDAQTGVVGATLPVQPAVIVRDLNVQSVRGARVAFLNKSTGTTTYATTDAAGVASVPWTLGTKAGAYQLQASESQSYQQVGFTATAVGGPPASIGAGLSSTTVAARASVSVALSLLDRYGNAAPDDTVALTPAAGGSTSRPFVVSDNAGHAAVSWTVGDTIGSYHLIAASGAASTTMQVGVVSGLPASVTKVTGDGLRIMATDLGASILEVAVRDAAGRPAPGVVPTWSVSDSTGSPCSALSVAPATGPDGIAEYCLPFFSTGRQLTVTATVGASSAVFSETVLDRPASFTLVDPSDTNAAVRAGQEYPGGIQVRVLLASGAPAVGYHVTFEGDSITQADSVTNTQGIASARWAPCCYGGRHTAQISLGPLPSISVPAFLIAPYAFYSIGAGTSHTCAWTLFVIRCWGANNVGQLGDGTLIRRALPDTVLMDMLPADGWLSIAGDRSCSMYPDQITAQGTVALPGRSDCWGRNLATGAVSETPVALGDDASYFTPGYDRTVLSAGPTAIAAGENHGCVLTSDANAYCWGSNTFGQIGDGTTTDRAKPVLIGGVKRSGIFQGVSFTGSGITVGTSHSCAITTIATYCWGRNDSGQLGDGTTTNRRSAVRVESSILFTQIVGGGAHTCGLTAAGAAYCWGDNSDGQLGTGTFGGNSSVPVAVAGGLVFTAITAGGQHTCGLVALMEEFKRAYCWGLNANGQLGDGTTTNRATPTPVADAQP